jgi:hypothetical protein
MLPSKARFRVQNPRVMDDDRELQGGIHAFLNPKMGFAINGAIRAKVSRF